MSSLDARPPEPGVDGFSPYAITTRSGPHVTMQAGVIHKGRFWTTTSRSSLKARSIRSHQVASAIIEKKGRATVVQGHTIALDPGDPTSALRDPIGALRSGLAVTRMVASQAEQVLGYLESAGNIPGGWLPHKRVLLVTRLQRRLVLDGWDVVKATGSWSDESSSLRLTFPGSADSVAPPLDLDGHAPRTFRRLIHEDAPSRVGLTTSTGPVVLPARWLGEDRMAVSAAALARIDLEPDARGAVVFDDSGDRRPDHKRGVLFRGDTRVVTVDGAIAVVRVIPDRMTTWDGFDAETIDLEPGDRAPLTAAR